MEYSDVIKNWKSFEEAIKNLGGDIQVFFVDKPATKNDIVKLENKLGFKVPPSLKEVLLSFSKKVEFRWFFPDGYELEGVLSQIFSGERHWSLEWIAQFNEDKNGWRDEVFSNKKDPYDLVWHNKLAFHEVGNGDYIAIDLSIPGQEPVIYLSHDDGEGHGIQLAKNFKEFIFLSSRLGCVGGEDWQWLPFVTEGKPYINPNCKSAINFRKLLGVKA